MPWSPRPSNFVHVLKARAIVLAAAMLMLAQAATGRAATVTVTDCSASGPADVRGRTTEIDVGNDDLVLKCHLSPLGNSERVRLRANNITVEGPGGGISSTSKGRAIDLWANGHITLTTATFEATNSNARVRLRSRTGFTILDSILTVGGIRPGRELRFECRGSGCGMNLCQSTIEAQRIRIVVDGTFINDGSTIRGVSPRDRIEIKSRNGDITFCGGQIIGDVEGRIIIEACGDIDLTQVEVSTGKNITIDAGECGVGQVILVGATVRNDFGKRGEIEITAAGGSGQVDITDATIIDDDRSATKNDVSEINGREQLPHEGFNNTVGTPSLDS